MLTGVQTDPTHRTPYLLLVHQFYYSLFGVLLGRFCAFCMFMISGQLKLNQSTFAWFLVIWYFNVGIQKIVAVQTSKPCEMNCEVTRSC